MDEGGEWVEGKEEGNEERMFFNEDESGREREGESGLILTRVVVAMTATSSSSSSNVVI